MSMGGWISAQTRGWFRRSLVAAVFAVAASTMEPHCADWVAAPPLEELRGARLLGHHALLRTAEGVTMALGADARPWVAAETDLDLEGAELVLVVDGEEHTLALQRESPVGGHVILRAIEPLAAPPLGAGTATLRLRGLALAEWPVRVTEAPPAPSDCPTETAGGEPEEEPRVLDPEERLARYAERARTAHLRGDPTADVVALWVEMARAAERLRVVSEQRRGLQAAAVTAMYGRRLEEAAELLDEVDALDRELGREDVGVVTNALYRGQLLYFEKEDREARALLAEAIARARELGMERERADLTMAYAEELSESNRHRAALAAIDEIRDLVTRAEESGEIRFPATFHGHRGLIEYRAAIDGVGIEGGGIGGFDAPKRSLRRAIDLAEGCLQPTYSLSAIANLAVIARREGRLDELDQWLQRYRGIDAEGAASYEPSILTLEGFLHLDRLEPHEAERTFRRAIRIRNEDFPPPTHDRWDATMGLGLVAEARGARAEAKIRFDEAVGDVLRLERRQPLLGGGRRSATDPTALFDAVIESALDDGDFERAFLHAQLRETRSVRSLDARSRVDRLDAEDRTEWRDRLARYEELRDAFERRRQTCRTVPEAELRECNRALAEQRRQVGQAFEEAYSVLEEAAPALVHQASFADVRARLGDSAALLFPVEVGGRQLTFRILGGELTVTEGPVGAQQLAWLEDPRRRIEHLYVLAARATGRDIVLSALPSGEPVLRRVTVSELPYLDLLTDRRAEVHGTPLIVADSRSDLRFARDEGRWARARLDAELLEGPQASRDRVLPALADSSLFHFSGHGRMSAEEPWDAHLQLADDGTLTLEELLIRRPRIERVVLSGCQTGSLGRAGAAVGLAEAFLLSGARSVLATIDDVDDGETAAFIQRFYEAGGADRPAEAYRVAALAEMAAGRRGYRAFRVLGLP